MTENKKRGRPPGRGKKKEVVGPFNPDVLSAEIKAVFDAPKLNTIEDEPPMYAKPQTSYPSNWNELGKIAKLEWLTANPRK